MDFLTTNTPETLANPSTSDVTISVPLTLMLTAKSGIKLKPQGAPSPREGILYYDKAMHILRYHSNNAWLNLTLERGLSDNLADKQVPSHVGTGTYRASDTEHKYLGSNSTYNEWKQWSNDGFRDFRIPQTIQTPITFNNSAIFTQDITMSAKKLMNITYPVLPNDVATKTYVDIMSRKPTSTDRGVIGAQADALLTRFITQIKAEHEKLNNLWEDRKKFKNGNTQYSTDPKDADYWSGAGLKQAMITTTRRLKNAGTI